MIDDSDDDVRLLLEEEINELKVKIDKLEIETYLASSMFVALVSSVT